ncbi:CU044_5270 family protein [Streptomyces sp. NPDC058812]|uniref:CU044_5270 family protein n=1 Tax=unclassified Streptomyces TaxID=2593676 RepID=UPI0036A373C9
MTPERHRGLEYEELAELLPAPGDPTLGPERHRALRRHLMREIGKKRMAAPRTFPGRRLVVWAAPLALAATAVTGTVVVTELQGEQEVVQTPSRVTTTVGDPPVITMNKDQFLYKRRVMSGDYTGFQGDAEVVQREDWLAVDGGRDGLVLTGPEDAVTDRLDPAAPTTEHMAMSGGTDYWEQLRELPTDPQKLLAYIYRETQGQGPTHEEAVFEHISALLEPAVLVPGLGEALYQAARRIPGVVVENEVQDRVGRTGTGLVLPNSGTGDRALVFDVSSFVFLGVERTTALLEIGVADRAGEAPVASWKLASR